MPGVEGDEVENEVKSKKGQGEAVISNVQNPLIG